MEQQRYTKMQHFHHTKIYIKVVKD